MNKTLLLILLFLVSSNSSFAEVDSSQLSQEVNRRLERVPEFNFIQEEANKLGVKVYLFGGTASAFAHYVRWDLERESGDDKYQAERFDYDFTNIYRGNQDLDIVVDGSPEQAHALKSILKEKYPHFIGEKEAWEVRLLRSKIDDKLPLLDDYDFLNQHTDTNSTGLLLINANQNGEIVFRDLFDWNNEESRFLKDVASAKIQYLFNENHKTTSRYIEGKNPPIFSAVRYLAKLTQYEVKGSKEDLVLIKKIIEKENWGRLSPYVKYKLEEFGKKVLINAPNSEYAWNLLEEVGLRKKLIEMDGARYDSVATLSWWMNKEPLRSTLLGKGKGKTVAEIFKDQLNKDGDLVLAHETNSFIAYENITRSSQGKANAFISRQGVAGEYAVHGDGFYTRIGVKGARGTGLTIRFKLKADAREGVDFKYIGEYVIVKNKNALTLIQEDLNLNIVDFFKLIDTGDIGKNDLGLLEKFKRKFKRVDTNSQEFLDAIAFVKQSIVIPKGFPKEASFEYTYSFPNFDSFEALFDFYYHEERIEFYNTIITPLLQDATYWNKKKRSKHWIYNSDWLNKISNIKSTKLRILIAQEIAGQDDQSAYEDIIRKFISQGDDELKEVIITEVLTYSPYWIDHSDAIQNMMKRDESREIKHLIIEYLLTSEVWGGQTELLVKIIDDTSYDEALLLDIIENVLVLDEWKRSVGAVKAILETGDPHATKILAQKVLSSKNWSSHPELVFDLLYSIIGQYREEEYDEFLPGDSHWRKNPVLKKYLGKKEINLKNLHEKDQKVDFEDWYKKYLSKNISCKAILM